MSGTWDQPSPPPYTRRPWDEVLREFAEQTGRPIWPVTMVNPSSNSRKTPLSEDQKQTARQMYRSGATVEEIGRDLGYSVSTVYKHLGWAS